MNIRDLFEAPISDISHIGNWDKNSSYGEQDRKLLNNPKAVEKIKSQWRFPEEVNFNIVLVNHADGIKNNEVGIVTHDWLGDNMPRVADQIEPLLSDSDVNIIFNSNRGEARVPMTGWIMAHRFGHAIESYGTRKEGNVGYYYHEADQTFQKTTAEILQEWYRLDVEDKPKWGVSRIGNHRRFVIKRGRGPVLGFLNAACTFRAAREGKIREAGEVTHESLAQYMFTGRVDFGQIPKTFQFGRDYYRFNGDDEDFAHVNMLWRETGEQMKEYFETCLHYCEGKIFVM